MGEKQNELVSVKNDRKDHKDRWDLVPLLDLEDVVKVYNAGVNKYGPNRWQNLEDGFERYRGALMRHLVAYMKGERYDAETGCMHLAQVAWNAIAILHYDKANKGLYEFKENGK